MYFPSDIESGNVEILDSNGAVIQTINLEKNPSGVYQYDWDGMTSSGNPAEEGLYYITASYRDPSGEDLTTRLGAYPIESVRFEGGETLVKVGSSYVPLSSIKEVY